MNDELSQLKEQADVLGIPYKSNIGVEALKAKVADALASSKPVEPEPEPAPAKANGEARAETAQEARARIQKEAMALVRVRIANLNPAKAHMKGEVITVGNKFTGAVSKYVSWGEDSDNGYHIPKIIFDELKARKFNSVRSVKGQNGTFHPVQRIVPEFSIEVLPPLTQEELDRLARTQAAAAGR